MIVLLLAALPLLAQPQTTPPLPAPPRPVNVPQPVEKRLSNGMRVIFVEKKGLPLVAARLMIATGAEADPADRGGLADMTGSLLTKGTRTRNAEQIARGVEALGATIASGAAWDVSFVAVSCLSPTFHTAMSYVADVALNPTFAQEEIDRLRDQNIDALSVALQDPGTLATFVAARVVYGAEPYGHLPGGTPASLRRITRSDIVRFHRSAYRPDRAILVIAGDLTAETAFATAEKLFGRWKAAPGESAAPPPGDTARTAADRKPRVVVVDMPEAGQSAVLVTRRGISRTDPAFVASQVANMVLGGDYSSRLNQEIRIRRGLSYGAGSSFDARRGPGPFEASAQTKNESAVDVAGILGSEISRLKGTSVPESELTPRKANLIGRFGRAIETTAGLVSRIGALALYGLPLSEINQYVASVQAVGAGDVQKFAARALEGDPDLVIVGDVRKFGAAFKERFPNAEIIPVDRLDLDSPTLRK